MWLLTTAYPLHRENRGNGKRNSLSGKMREFGNFAKTQGIWFAQVVNTLTLKLNDISKFAAEICRKKLKLDKSAKSVLCM